MAAAGGRYASREGLRYSAGVESRALEQQRRPPASVKRSVNGEARLTKGRGEEGRGVINTRVPTDSSSFSIPVGIWGTARLMETQSLRSGMSLPR